MPVHIHPLIRFKEEVGESEGLIVSRDSDGVTRKKQAETAGTLPKVVPLVFYHGITKGKITAS
jgi:hypothetical protein